MEYCDRATPVFFLRHGEVCVSLRVFGHLYIVFLCQSQHGEAPYRKQTSVERKPELMEIIYKFTHGAGILKLTLIEAITSCAIHKSKTQNRTHSYHSCVNHNQ